MTAMIPYILCQIWSSSFDKAESSLVKYVNRKVSFLYYFCSMRILHGV